MPKGIVVHARLVNKKELEAAYDDLYRRGQAVLDKHKPCGFHKGPNGKIRCVIADGPCCGGCEHLGPKGCKVESLTCKLHLCGAASYLTANQEAVKELRALDRERYDKGVPTAMRLSKKQAFARYR